MEVLRERASARKALVSQEAEVAESAIQLASLDEFIQQLQGRLDEVERHFGRGRVFAPIAGIVSTGLAHVGQSLVAGTPIAEILDPTDIFVDWYIPNERLIDPKVGNEVFVLFGNRRIPGKIAEILPVSAVYAGTQQLLRRDRPATQIARIRFDPGAVAAAAELYGLRSHALHRPFRPHRRRADPSLRASLNMTPRMRRGAPHDAD